MGFSYFNSEAMKENASEWGKTYSEEEGKLDI